MKNVNDMNLKTIDGLTHASIHLLDQIDEQDEIIIALLDQHSKEDLLLAAEESNRIIENMLDGKTTEDYIEQHGEPKFTEIDGSAYQNAVNAQRAFINTYDHCDLMVIDQDATYVLVEKGEKLVSPAGFHPSQRVFIKTRTALSVTKLPKHSNLIAYKLEPAEPFLERISRSLPTANAPISEHCLFIRMCAKQYDYSIRASFNDYLVENEAVQGNEKLIAAIRHQLNTTVDVAK